MCGRHYIATSDVASLAGHTAVALSQLTAWVANKVTAVWPAILTDDWSNISACYSVIEI